MELRDNVFDLGMISFEGENFSDSYNKFSSVLEKNPNHKEAWIYKGLSAAYLVVPNENEFKETEVCLSQAKKSGLDENEKEVISIHIILSAKKFLNKIFKILQESEIDSQKKPMATGELYSTRSLRLLSESLAALIDNWENFKVAIEFSKSSFEYSETPEQGKKVLEVIDIIHKKSTEKKASPKYLPELERKRTSIISKISSLDPSFIPPVVKDSNEGCFIATAVYGNYDAPEVLELRDFRDSLLKKFLVGRALIKMYYQVSPSLAEIIRPRSELKLFAYLTIILPTTLIWKSIKRIVH